MLYLNKWDLLFDLAICVTKLILKATLAVLVVSCLEHFQRVSRLQDYQHMNSMFPLSWERASSIAFVCNLTTLSSTLFCGLPSQWREPSSYLC